jgi:predicted aconitase with swiveling domain
MEPLVELVEYALVIGQPEPMVIVGSVVMALMIGHPEPMKIAGAVVMTLVVVVVVMARLLEMAESVEYAYVKPKVFRTLSKKIYT